MSYRTTILSAIGFSILACSLFGAKSAEAFFNNNNYYYGSPCCSQSSYYVQPPYYYPQSSPFYYPQYSYPANYTRGVSLNFGINLGLTSYGYGSNYNPYGYGNYGYPNYNAGMYY